MIEAAIFDYGRTIHNPETDRLFLGCEILLISLQDEGIKLGLVSRGQDVEKRKQDFEKFGLGKYFVVMEITGEGVTKEFGPILEKLGVSTNRVVIVGDRIKSEIVEGNKIGATTIWFRNGKFADELPETPEEQPDFTVSSLAEVLPIIRQLKKS